MKVALSFLVLGFHPSFVGRRGTEDEDYFSVDVTFRASLLPGEMSATIDKIIID
jgi:hypothetical protein